MKRLLSFLGSIRAAATRFDGPERKSRAGEAGSARFRFPAEDVFIHE